MNDIFINEFLTFLDLHVTYISLVGVRIVGRLGSTESPYWVSWITVEKVLELIILIFSPSKSQKRCNQDESYLIEMETFDCLVENETNIPIQLVTFIVAQLRT